MSDSVNQTLKNFIDMVTAVRGSEAAVTDLSEFCDKLIKQYKRLLRDNQHNDLDWVKNRLFWAQDKKDRFTAKLEAMKAALAAGLSEEGAFRLLFSVYGDRATDPVKATPIEMISTVLERVLPVYFKATQAATPPMAPLTPDWWAAQDFEDEDEDEEEDSSNEASAPATSSASDEPDSP